MLKNGSYIAGNSKILMLILNTDQFQSDAWLLRYLRNHFVYQIIEKQKVEAKRIHNNRGQIIYNVLTLTIRAFQNP